MPKDKKKDTGDEKDDKGVDHAEEAFNARMHATTGPRRAMPTVGGSGGGTGMTSLGATVSGTGRSSGPSLDDARRDAEYYRTIADRRSRKG